MTDPIDPSVSGPSPQGVRHGLSRRQMVVATAWAVPVITLAVATPAFAASANASLTLVWGNGSAARFTGASLADATATVLSRGGSWDVGENVTFTVLSGPASFGGSATAVIPTGPAGTAMATGLTTTGVGTVMLRASVSGLPTQTITIDVVDLPVLTIDNPSRVIVAGGSTILTGTVQVNGAPPAMPTSYPVTFTITGGSAQFAGGLQTITVNPTPGTGVVAAPALADTGTALGDQITVTASVAGGNSSLTYELFVTSAISANSPFVSAVQRGATAIPIVEDATHFGSFLPVGLTMDVTWDDPTYVANPVPGWSKTPLGGGTDRFVLTTSIQIVNFPSNAEVVTNFPTGGWDATLYVSTSSSSGPRSGSWDPSTGFSHD
jgi:hypothetical protein